MTALTWTESLALNNAHAQELSLLDEHRLRGMIAMAFHAVATSDGSALLIAFDQSADYVGGEKLEE